jgi:hypothetical protein
MQEDLVVAKQLGDTLGECRAHGNLGSAYFSKGNFKVRSNIFSVTNCNAFYHMLIRKKPAPGDQSPN